MNTVLLPSGLPSDLDLAKVNRDLRAGRSLLDWSGVQDAKDEALGVLLADLDLAADAHVLGLETIPEHLFEAVERALSPRAERPRRRSDGQSALAPTPAEWKPEPEDIEVGVVGTIVRGTAVSEPPVPDPAVTPRLGAPTPVAIRDEFERLVLADLLGPAGGPEEEIDERTVRDRYLVGMLAPKARRVDASEDDDFVIAGDESPEEGGVDPVAAGPETMFASSFGLTFSVDGQADGLRITARWGRYVRVDSERLAARDSGGPIRVWKRIPTEGIRDRLELEEGTVPRWQVHPDVPNVSVQGIMRRREEDWIVSLFLVNEQDEPKRNADTAWLFQPELIVELVDGSAAFTRRPHVRDDASVSAALVEDQAMAMLYRKQVEFAAGHGVGVHVETEDDVFERAVRISTRVVPSYDVPMTTAPMADEIPALADLVLDMQKLGTMLPADMGTSLAPLKVAYAAWIEEQHARARDEADGLDIHKDAAAVALEHCEQTLKRIDEGIKLIASDPLAAEAFRFMNRAMALQRIHGIYAELVRRGAATDLAAVDVPTNRSWYPFQLAFILLNLPSLTNLHHEDRAVTGDATADLLWFPTGGGKTEAYLGLTAYTLAMRRLQGDLGGRSGHEGLAVLMRYTLRLLTLQQFQRAATLLCACEVLRLERLTAGDPRWGDAPFRIGLWVGQRMTPNWTEQSAEAIRQEHGHFRRGGAIGGSGTPAQLPHCPWCGTRIEPGRDIVVEMYGQGRARTITYCGDPLGSCPFSRRQAPGEGLPVVVVDEEIYRRLPSVLIATVDKFAQMPWVGPTEMLFGQVDGACDRHGFRSPDLEDMDSHPPRNPLPRARTVPRNPLRPPDLIIQDELHLIAGPLGSLVGAYETAVDELATWEVDGKRVRPKVIASTATIRRAPDQVRALFLRTVNVFPPHGLEIEDTFFARQRLPSEQFPGRRYIGICAQGRRLKAVLIRVYVAHLAAAQLLYERYGKAADPWMTLVGYFNAMRELGGMRRLVDDDVRQRLGQTDRRGLARRRPPYVEELTSRKASTEIPAILDQLEVRFDPAVEAERLAKQRSGQRINTPMPIDVLLATNMVSVGVDVKRLGLMVVGGQPKTTAEYIQATSRVGRTFPGFVCAVLNWARPRDLSHYERFEHYHATFYQQVEALSVTPFSPRAIDRSLTALLVSLVRLRGTEFNKNEAAGRISRTHPYIQAAIDAITRRAWDVSLRADRRDLVKAELEERVDEWLSEASKLAGGRLLGYRDKKDGVTTGLLRAPTLDPWDQFTVLTSLRDVEPTVNLVLDDRGLDDEPITPAARAATTSGVDV